jgi:type II secretion system protein G
VCSPLNKPPLRGRENGFTLVEVLVVMVIIGLLAAIAIPSFFKQHNKANDASAKESVRTAQTAMETYSTDHSGSYAGAAVTDLQAIEPTVRPSTEIRGTGGTGTTGNNNYRVTVTSADGRMFSVDRDGGTLTYPCVVPSGVERGGCPSGDRWN